ncbi:unnamed protein product, partial [Closterium sp. NIES-54]
ANNVPMIQTAAIGVGIQGHEGRQAVMASDFAISQFRFLARLLLVLIVFAHSFSCSHSPAPSIRSQRRADDSDGAIGVGIRSHEGRQAAMASGFAISQFRFLARLLLVLIVYALSLSQPTFPSFPTGANDVPMIQTAAIGVGIRGHEGRQAVMASDFAISQFRFLARLLLVHGHWNYHRMAYMIVYNLYKNTVFVLLLFWYLSQTAFSTTPAIGQLSLMFFSLTYTTLPTVVVASIDQTLLPTRLLAWPQLYGAGQREETYNLPVFLAAMLDATWQSLALFLVGVATVSGLDGDMWALGQTWLVALVLVVTVHLAMDIRRWTWLHAAAIAIAILVTVVSIVVIDYIPLLPEYG